MYIVAIAWIYVTLLMALTERSFVAGIATFVFYGLLPLALFLWLIGTPERRRRRRRQQAAAAAADAAVAAAAPTEDAAADADAIAAPATTAAPARFDERPTGDGAASSARGR